MNPSQQPDQTKTDVPATPPAESAELARELDRLRVAGHENRAFIRATRRELRKPLNALAGILRDLSAQMADREAANSLRTALHWTMSLGRLTNDLLDLAVLQADEAEIGALEFDVRDVVEEVAKATRLPGREDSPLTVEVRPEVPSMLVGHPNRIRQILAAGTQHVIATRGAWSLHLGLARLGETQTHVDLLFALHHAAPTDPPLDQKSMDDSIEADFGYLVAQRLARGLGGSLELLDGGDAVHLRLKLRKFSPTEEIVDVSRAVKEADAAPGPAPKAVLPAAAVEPLTRTRPPAPPAPPPAAPPAPVAHREPAAVPPPPPAPEARTPEPPAATLRPDDRPAAPTTPAAAAQTLAPPASTAAAPAAPKPVAAPAPAPRPSQASAATVSEVPEITLKGTRVLLAGSSGPSNVALQIELRALGCESAAVTTVEDALHALLDSSRRMRPYHICIADFSGTGDGAEQLISRIREEEELRHLQMLLLVEMGASGDAEWAEQLGYGAYMSKPVQRDDLGAVFKELMQRSVAVDPDAARLITRHSVRETRRRRLNCLVVDDDRVNLLALKTVIERLGHAVDLAGTGPEAIEKSSQQRFDLILSDVRMPDLDGDQVTAEILAMQRTRGEHPTPIFAMSANSLPGDSQRCRASGMRNYFLKPLTLPLLTQLLRYALEDHAEPGAAAPAAGAVADAQATADAAPAPKPVPEQEIQVADHGDTYGEATPIDMDHLEMASVGVPELRSQMLSTFIKEMSAGMERLGDFIGDGNHGASAILASALNSTCASIGARECSQHLAEMERRAAAGDLATLDTLYAESLAQWDRVKAFATQLLEETPPQGG